MPYRGSRDLTLTVLLTVALWTFAPIPFDIDMVSASHNNRLAQPSANNVGSNTEGVPTAGTGFAPGSSTYLRATRVITHGSARERVYTKLLVALGPLQYQPGLPGQITVGELVLHSPGRSSVYAIDPTSSGSGGVFDITFRYRTC